MLVSFKHKFIFLRPYFSGSTSTEYALSRFCLLKKDILTPVSFPEEINRRKLKIYPRNYGLKYFEKIYNLSVLLRNRNISDFFLVKGKTMLLKNHSNIENLLNYKKMNISDFEIISITRHPYEKALSCARWSLVKHKYLKEGIKIVPSPDEILHSLIANYKSGRLKSINNWPIYTFNGKYIVDLMINYSDLDNIDKILDKKFKLGSFKLPKLKQHYSRTHVTTSMISDEIKRYIQEICSEEFDKFSYEK